MLKSKHIKIFNIVIIATMLLLSSACDNQKAELKNMNQIHKENGIPVKTEIVSAKIISNKLNYNAMLTGVKETSVFAKVGDRIEKIFVKVGDFVKKDQLLLTLPKNNPRAKYYQAKVAFENSKTSYERYKKLYETGGISLQTLDNIKTQYKVSKANFDNVKELIKVTAPISGYITKISVRENDNVKEKAHLFTIANVSKLKAKILISEKEIEAFKKGVEAIATWQGKTIYGKIVEIDVAMNPRTQAFQVVAEFDNSKKEIRAGTTAEIQIINKSEKPIIAIDRKNLIIRENETFVFVANKNIAKKRKVTLGKNYGLKVEVLSGLKDGDSIITEGQLLLKDNVKIQNINEVK